MPPITSEFKVRELTVDAVKKAHELITWEHLHNVYQKQNDLGQTIIQAAFVGVTIRDISVFVFSLVFHCQNNKTLISMLPDVREP